MDLERDRTLSIRQSKNNKAEARVGDKTVDCRGK